MKTLLQNLQAMANNIAGVAAQNWIAAHRGELIEAIQTADTYRARSILLEICEAQPEVAGVITLLMNGTPDQAINNVALFDAGLANELRAHVDTLAQVQQLMRAPERKKPC